MTPRRNVPVVTTTARQEKVRPSASSTPATAPASDDNAGRFALDNREVGRLRDERLHRAPIESAVGLSARALDGGALAAIEDAKLDARRVGGARHQPVKRVDLAHQMSLAEAADRRVAGHFADGRETAGSRARSRRRNARPRSRLRIRRVRRRSR